VPVDHVRLAIESGLGVLGENRVQDSEAKIEELREAGGVEWHFLGRLQSNKVGRAVALFDVIESIDSVELAERVARVAREASRAPYPVYVQVNVDSDPAKAGVAPDEAPGVVSEIVALDGLEVRGLMTVGRLVSDPEEARSSFAALRRLSEDLSARVPGLGAGLSMGMSDDFEVAVEEGATIVRLGRVIFGERPTA
jgi:pyridoxal phosphate enzyme (YggS family)